MSKPKPEPRQAQPVQVLPGALPAGIVAASLAGLAAAWVAAGSVGLMAVPLRHVLVWVLMALALAACWPQKRTWPAILPLLAALAAAVVMTASPLEAVNVMAVAVFFAGLCMARADAGRKVLLVVSQAAAVFGIYRIILTGVPAVWAVADRASGWLGAAAGAVTGQPLSVGPSFAGLDFLVLMGLMAGLWVAAGSKPRWVRGLAAAGGIVAAHLVYLVVLAYAPRLMAAIPAAGEVAAATAAPHTEKAWSFWSAINTLLPWNLPVLAGIAQLLVAAAVLRWSPPPAAAAAEGERTDRARAVAAGVALAAGLAAAVLPMATTLYGRQGDLAGKKFVANEKGFLNWLRPVHGEYGRLVIGMYGMLPDLIESFGGTLVRTTTFSKEDLEGASAVILLYPNQPWGEGQLARIWDFVRGGGSLLIMGEHTIRESDGGSRFNDVLAPTDIHVNFDCAQWAVGGWLNCYEPAGHPITAGKRQERNEFGVVIGASVNARWPARPLIMGRWGWSDWGDPGSGRAMMGNDRYDGGERLGDVYLAAEQSFGRGKIVVFGDTSSMTNGINIGSYPFTSTLLGYLAGPDSAPALWRTLLALVAAAAAAVLLWHGWLVQPWGTSPACATAGQASRATARVAIVALAAGAALAASAACTHRANITLPDGARRQPNNLAYIDTSHLEAFSQESLRDDGIMGLEHMLLRCGFLTLALGDFRAEALDRAALLVSVAPARPFSDTERRAVRDFVEKGGVFICTAGYDQSEAVAPLLADFGLRVGSPEGRDREPRPLGHFKSPYVNVKGRIHFVRFHAAWPVAQDDSALAEGGSRKAGPPQVIAYGPDNVPVILMRPWGKGKVVVVGDTGFAMNKNLERVDGSPFEGLRENADFWRWFLGYVADREPWMPPGPEAPPATAPAAAASAPAAAPASAPAAPASASAAPASAPAKKPADPKMPAEVKP